MRIINHQQFLNLPSGTVFAKCHPCVIGDIQIKGDTREKDFNCLGFQSFESDADFADDFFEMIEKGTSVPLDLDCWGRDGLACYEDNQLFMIYERADISAMIAKLQECIKNGSPKPSNPECLNEPN